jgi:hypothetical protein
MNAFPLKPLTTALLAALALSSGVVFANTDEIPTTEAPEVETTEIPQIPGAGPMSECLTQIKLGAPFGAIDTQALKSQREQGKLAQDVYQTFANEWQVQVFANISQVSAERRDMVACLLQAGGTEVTEDEQAGEFENEQTQEWYGKLTERGAASVSDALRAAALVEEAALVGLQQALASVQSPEAATAYETLLRISERKLGALTLALEEEGEDYEPQILSEDVIKKILPTPVAFGLDNQKLNIPAVRLLKDGQLLPAEETYRAELSLAADGNTMYVENIERVETTEAEHLAEMAELADVAQASFDLDNMSLSVPGLRLTQAEEVLPPEETYNAQLRMNTDGNSFQIENVQRGRR